MLLKRGILQKIQIFIFVLAVWKFPNFLQLFSNLLPYCFPNYMPII